ncbi:MAG: hypothetical protein FWE07_07630 [Turicibacter sp.]|nr:hypothetical protein [Turicibacter sp.]
MNKITQIILESHQSADQETINLFQKKLNELIGMEFNEEKIQQNINYFIREMTGNASADSKTALGMVKNIANLGAYRFHVSQDKKGKFKGSFFGIGLINSTIEFEFIIERVMLR